MSDISNIEITVPGLLYEHQHYANRLEEIIKIRSNAKLGRSRMFIDKSGFRKA